MSEITKNNLRLAGIGIILASLVLPGREIDVLANIAMIGLFVDWGARLVSQNGRLK